MWNRKVASCFILSVKNSKLNQTSTLHSLNIHLLSSSPYFLIENNLTQKGIITLSQNSFPRKNAWKMYVLVPCLPHPHTLGNNESNPAMQIILCKLLSQRPKSLCVKKFKDREHTISMHTSEDYIRSFSSHFTLFFMIM